MIGIDTNILIRWVTQDDALQCKQVEEIFQKHHSLNDKKMVVLKILHS